MVLAIHANLCQSRAQHLFYDGKWSALPAGFNAAGMGDACRFARRLLKLVADGPYRPELHQSSFLDTLQALEAAEVRA